MSIDSMLLREIISGSLKQIVKETLDKDVSLSVEDVSVNVVAPVEERKVKIRMYVEAELDEKDLEKIIFKEES